MLDHANVPRCPPSSQLPAADRQNEAAPCEPETGPLSPGLDQRDRRQLDRKLDSNSTVDQCNSTDLDRQTSAASLTADPMLPRATRLAGLGGFAAGRGSANGVSAAFIWANVFFFVING